MSHRILMITGNFPPQVGGVAASSSRIAHAIAANGYVVHVLNTTPDITPGLVQSERVGEMMVHRLGTLDSPDLTLQLAEVVAGNLHDHVGFDLVHGHFVTPFGYLAAYLAARWGVPSYVSVRGNDVDRGIFRPDQFPQLLWTLQRAGGVGCVSRELVEKCQLFSGRDDMRYTPNAVNTTVFRPLPRSEALLRELRYQGETLLGFVGELRFKKGTQFVLEALRVVREQRPAKLLLVGGMRHEDKSLLRRYLRQYPELREAIHVVDYVHDQEVLAQYYNLMDIVLSPSLWEGMPNSVLEAMACGRVVLASNAGGIRDVVTHGETGVLLGTDALHSFGEACLEILAAGEAFSMHIGQNARAYVETHHTPDGEIALLCDIYAGLLASSAS